MNKKKIYWVVMITAVAIVLGGCSSGTTDNYKNFEQQIVYDADGILIEVTGISGGKDYLSVILNVQNDSSDGIKIYNNYFVVDGLMLPASGVIEAAANAENEGDFRLQRRALEVCGRQSIGELGISLRIENQRTDEDYKTPMATVQTPNAKSVDPPMEFEGESVFDFQSEQGRIVIRYLGLSNAPYSGDSPIFIGSYVENTMSTPVSVSLYNVVLNGNKVQSRLLHDVVPPKSGGYLPLTFADDKLETIGIHNIDDIDTISFSVAGIDQELMVVIDGVPTSYVGYFNKDIEAFAAQ